MGRVRNLPSAQEDYDKIWRRIAKDNIVNADRFLDRLEQASQKLADSPFHDSNKRPNLRHDLRRCNFENYAIVYRPESDGITVVGVYHGKYIDQKLDRLNQIAASLDQEDKRREQAKAVLREHGPAGRGASAPSKARETGQEPER